MHKVLSCAHLLLNLDIRARKHRYVFLFCRVALFSYQTNLLLSHSKKLSEFYLVQIFRINLTRGVHDLVSNWNRTEPQNEKKISYENESNHTFVSNRIKTESHMQSGFDSSWSSENLKPESIEFNKICLLF